MSIVKEDLPGEIEEFQSKAWPEAEVFVDMSTGLYSVASGKLRKVSGAAFGGWLCNVLCCSSPSRRKSLSASSKEYGTNYKGEGLVLGSILVVDQTGTIAYAHAEKAFDDHPDFSDVVAAALEAAPEAAETTSSKC